MRMKHCGKWLKRGRFPINELKTQSELWTLDKTITVSLVFFFFLTKPQNEEHAQAERSFLAVKAVLLAY